MRHFASFFVLALAACATEQGKSVPQAEGGSAGGASASAAPLAGATPDTTRSQSDSPTDSVSAAMSPPAAPVNRTVGRIDVDKEFPVVRALYVNRFAAQSTKRMKQLIKIADETEINAFVIDLKDEFGLNYKPSNP